MIFRVALGIASLPLIIGSIQRVEAAAAPPPAQSYSIDQTRYFATPEIEQAELKSRLAEAAGFPVAAPDDAKALLGYLQRAEGLLSQLRHFPSRSLRPYAKTQ
jgi:hypothetical protein